jgi:hypothetical protein
VPPIWQSFEEYKKAVLPRFVNQGHFSQARSATAFGMLQHLHERATHLSTLIPILTEMHSKLFLDGATPYPLLPAITMAVEDGEYVLLCYPRLTGGRPFHRFVTATDIIDGFADDPIEEQRWALGAFLQACRDLLADLAAMAEDDVSFLVSELKVPDNLASDFYLARDLFSVDLDGVGVLVAARGLEGVLRRVAEWQQITLVTGRGQQRACDAEMRDVIEVMHHARWKATKRALISTEMKGLLHYLRAVRNSDAHSSPERPTRAAARETASLIAKAANDVWRQCTRPRVRLETRAINKTFSAALAYSCAPRSGCHPSSRAVSVFNTRVSRPERVARIRITARRRIVL